MEDLRGLVDIFHDPVTGKKLEGRAKLVECVRPDTGDGLALWLVEFLDEPGAQYQRTVNMANANRVIA